MNQSPKRILIIDDAESIHRTCRQVLCAPSSHLEDELLQLEADLFGVSTPRAWSSRMSFEVDSAFQGMEGLAKVKQTVEAGQPYALAILDYRMPPGWNGIETLRHLWQVDPSLPVLLCSAYSDHAWEHIHQEFCKSPLLVELKKPFDGLALLTRAQSLSALRA